MIFNPSFFPTAPFENINNCFPLIGHVRNIHNLYRSQTKEQSLFEKAVSLFNATTEGSVRSLMRSGVHLEPSAKAILHLVHVCAKRHILKELEKQPGLKEKMDVLDRIIFDFEANEDPIQEVVKIYVSVFTILRGKLIHDMYERMSERQKPKYLPVD